MKLFNKRSLAWLASLLMLVSVFASVIVLPTEAATVDYVTSGKYVYNWGQREVEATFLSPMAEAWYEENNVTYEELAALKGSSSTGSVPSSSLYKELQSLMKSNHTYETSYNATKDLFKYTDCQNGGGKISSFYSGKEIGPTWDGGWNREHTWPNSKGDASGNGENDIIMLRPTSTSENSGRGNTAYGQSSGYYNPNSESNGKYDLRGDVARIMLFVYCRWGNTGKMWGTSGVMESLAVLLQWVEEDPVDTWELGRNDAAEAITGTRNVFVDYPELIFVLFGAEIPTDYQTPSGKAAEGAFEITATSNNTAYGTVSVSGKVINATPKTGYEVVGYDVIGGSATVTRNGNAFTVDATSDVSIRINFAPRTEVSIRFVQGAEVLSTVNAYVGDEVILPQFNGALNDIEGLSFVGWAVSTVEQTTTVPTYYPAGSKITATTDAVYYALFSRTEQDGGNNSNVFLPYTGELTEGDYLIVYGGKAMIGSVTDKTRLDVVDITMQGSAVVLSDERAVWHIAPEGDYWTLYNTAAGKYAVGTTVKSSNQANLSPTLNDYAKWTLAVKSTGYEFTNVGRVALGANPLLRYNVSVNAFACYATNTTAGGPNLLYKRVSGTTYYFTEAGEICVHQYEESAGQDATCGKDGSVICLCTLCGYSYTKVIPATGEHTYDDRYDADCNVCGATREVPEKPAHTPGDINGDGSVNNRDLVRLQQYINEWDVEVVEEALDVNGDGSVNNRDLVRLQQYINEWDVEIF